jgi:hypothetical protein
MASAAATARAARGRRQDGPHQLPASIGDHRPCLYRLRPLPQHHPETWTDTGLLGLAGTGSGECLVAQEIPLRPRRMDMAHADLREPAVDACDPRLACNQRSRRRGNDLNPCTQAAPGSPQPGLENDSRARSYAVGLARLPARPAPLGRVREALLLEELLLARRRDKLVAAGGDPRRAWSLAGMA